MLPTRIRCAARFVLGLRLHDSRAARRFINTKFAGGPLPVQWWRFLCWSVRQVFVVIPDAMQDITIARPLSRTPMWLLDPNPWSDHPWRRAPAEQFAKAYCKAAYRNADLIEQTIRAEGFDCDYAREGWGQACDADEQPALTESVEEALRCGFTDWTRLTPALVAKKTGMRVPHNAGHSVEAGGSGQASLAESRARSQEPRIRSSKSRVMIAEEVRNRPVAWSPFSR